MAFKVKILLEQKSYSVRMAFKVKMLLCATLQPMSNNDTLIKDSFVVLRPLLYNKDTFLTRIRFSCHFYFGYKRNVFIPLLKKNNVGCIYVK